MTEEFTLQNARRIAQSALIAEWHAQVTHGVLTEAGLVRLRARLRAPESIEFEPGPGVEHLLLRVDEALAKMRGIGPAELPGSPLAMPDTPEGLET